MYSNAPESSLNYPDLERTQSPAPPLKSQPISPHRVLRNSAFNISTQALYAGFHLASIMMLARGLGRDGLGAYFKLFALILVGQVFVESGISTILTHRIARKPERFHKIVAEAIGLFTLIISGTLALFLMLGLVWSSSIQTPGILMRCLAAGVACAAIQVQRLCASIFYAFEFFAFDNLMKILQGALFCGSVLVLINWLGYRSAEVALWLLAASHIAGAVFMLIVLQSQRPCLGWRLDFSYARDWLSEALPFGAGDGLRGVMIQVDTIILSLLKSDAVVGIYSVANRWLGPLNWLPRAVLTAAFPSLVRLADEDRAGFIRVMGASLRLLWIIGLPITVAICVCAKPFVLILAGPDFLEAVHPLRLLIWIVNLSFLSFQFRFFFAALGLSRLYIFLVASVLLFDIIVNLALIPSWGYYGACAASLGGEFLFTGIGLAVMRYSLGQWGLPLGQMLLASFAAAGMAIPLWFARELPIPLLITAVLLATCFYFTLCIVLGALSRKEVQHFFESLTRTARRPVKEELVN